MTHLQRRIYGAVIRLHPAAFREEFGSEMAHDCEDALQARGFAALLGDAIVSLGRQWKARALAPREAEQPVTSHPFLAGQYFMVDQGRLTVFDLACASVLSAMLFFAVGFAANLPNQRAAANLQAVESSHDGGIDNARHNPSFAASNQGRREGAVNSSYSYGVTAAHGVVRLGHGPGFGGWSLRSGLRGGSPAGSLADALRQLTMISTVLWLTSFFLRRSPGIGKRVVLTALGLLGVAASVAFGSVPMPPVHAQILHATAPLPSFEVATVRPWQPPQMIPPPVPAPTGLPDVRPTGPPRRWDPGRPGGQRTDRVHVIGQVSILLQLAFNLPVGSERQIVGAPGWVMSEADRYEIQAKIDSSLFAAMQTMTPTQQREQVDLLEQSLLADRFKLKVHFETREQPAFALVVVKGGSKLTPAKPGETPQLSASANETTGTAVTLDQFVHSPLLRPEGRIVIDQTGLTGAYDFTIKGEDGADPASFFTLIQEQLGLKLVPAKAPVEVIVIDHIEKPSEN